MEKLDPNATNYVAPFYLDKKRIGDALLCLVNNGVEPGESEIVLKSLCYILMGKEIEPLLEIFKEEEDMMEFLRTGVYHNDAK